MRKAHLVLTLSATAQHEFHQKRLDKAHRRHLWATKTLAQVRKLLKGKDVTQINIAEQQMNFAGRSDGDG